MAEAAVHVAITKLDDALGRETLKLTSFLLANEFSLLTQLEGSMGRVRSEFLVMHAFLSGIDMGKDDKATEAWLGEVRKLAYLVEDIMDEYVYLTGRQHRSRWRGFLPDILKRSRNVADWHRIASQLRDTESNLGHISRIKNAWTKIGSGGTGNSHYDNEASLHIADSSHFIEEDKIVGIAENKKKLTEWLAVDEPDCFVISVWGMGGLGKTTLVTHVYNNEWKNFDCHAWISISQSYKTDLLLRTIIKGLFERSLEIVPHDIHTMDLRRLKETIRNYLEGKRYLVILDDVWSPRVYYDICDAFAPNEYGSRIVITTRIGEVASLAIDRHKLELKSLEEKEAWDLFCNRAFWQDKNRECPPDLQSCARKFLLKCQGLPLAIVSIGSFLSLREKTVSEWRKIYDQLNWEFDNNKNLSHIKQILNLSYNYLPRFLRNCFLYCSIFPEDYLLKRKRLIRLWISEGFVEERGTQTLEEVAEDNLKELIYRCMLQVVNRNQFGRVKSCRMHDIVRELAISIYKRENFTIVSDSLGNLQIGSEARRLLLQGCDNGTKSSINLPRLRSFVTFDKTISSSLLSSLCSNSRYLTVLDLQGVPIEKIPNEVCNLFNLHYLGLRETKVKVLPKSLGCLRNLQVLDLGSSGIEKLPSSISKLRNLRHLFAENIVDSTFRAFHCFHGVQAPKGLWDLRCLQTLQSVEARMDLVGQLGNLTQLRSLRIMNVRSIHCTRLCSSISKMRFLSNLYVLASDDNEVLQFRNLNPPLQYLQKLHLQGRLEEGLKSALFQSLGCNLRRLFLGWCWLTEDPLPSLSHLCNLVFLRFCGTYDGQLLCYSEGWFPNLKVLCLEGMPQLNQVVIEKGALERLDQLYMVDLGSLKELPQGTQFLTSLQILYVDDLHPELKERLEKDDDISKIQHIPIVQCIYQREGKKYRKTLFSSHRSQQKGPDVMV